MDRIRLNRIAVYAYHGAFAEEATLGQRFFISAEAALSLQEAGQNDDLSKTVHYGELALLLHKIATEERHNLIEALAERLAAVALETFGLIRAITITIEKPNAPIPLPMDGVTVEITRSREDR